MGACVTDGLLAKHENQSQRDVERSGELAVASRDGPPPKPRHRAQ